MEPPTDTSMGGRARRFPSTRWSAILEARDWASPDHEKAMNELCALYWKPVYAYIRTVRGVSNEDAKDLTQAFFEEMFERRFLDRASAEIGTFRSYLRGAVHLFLLKQHERGQALKRGGGRRFVPLDDARLEDAPLELDPASSAEDTFDRHWGIALISQGLEELRLEMERSGRELWFRAFDRYALRPPANAAPTYAQVAAEFGLKETDVGNYLAACRRRLREILTDRIRDYVRSDDEVYPEFARVFALFGVLRE